MGSPGSNGGRDAPNLETPCIFFREPMFLSRGGCRPTMKKTREIQMSDSQKLCKVHLFGIGWSRDVLKFKEFFRHARKCSSFCRVATPNCRRIGGARCPTCRICLESNRCKQPGHAEMRGDVDWGLKNRMGQILFPTFPAWNHQPFETPAGFKPPDVGRPYNFDLG